MPFQTTRRVEFSHTDAAGIMHFASFFAMMESAEHEMLRDLGFSVMPPPGRSPRLTWPRVSTSCDYRSAARFEDELAIAVTVERVGKTSVAYRFDFSREGESIATGKLVAVCCDLASGHLVKTAIPDSIRQSLNTHC